MPTPTAGRPQPLATNWLDRKVSRISPVGSSEHAGRGIVIDLAGVLIGWRRIRVTPSAVARQRTALLELEDAVGLRERCPPHVGQQLLLTIERGHQLAGLSGFVAVEVNHP